MDTTSILTPSHTAAAQRGAYHLPAAGPAQGAARAAVGHGFAVKSMDQLLGSDAAVDEVAFTQVRVELNYDKSSQRTVVTVLDPDTGDVLNQFPAENILRSARDLRELLARKFDMKV
ncbi:FlaG protein [Tistlia consotensis]|uniref:FlaG protein n=1 Tax=Tistlia consotensis USBA 355 TaxID=560819 RepID=A0A1Y6CPP4_9PROT|nr:flagellar protein FlaG [Tistlia consotensis]SMF67794.1 FlaG protein [Tistlia consotensis USBA 355]SNR99506.1 FlaG protein [Tistlia consotensis]